MWTPPKPAPEEILAEHECLSCGRSLVEVRDNVCQWGNRYWCIDCFLPAVPHVSQPVIQPPLITAARKDKP